MNFFAISGLINGVTATSFGLFGYLQNKKSSLHKIFGLMNLSVAIWSYSYFLWQIAQDEVTALFWVRALAFGATLVPIFYLHWILTILDLDKKKKKILIFGYLLTSIFIILSLTPFYVTGVGPQLSFPYWPRGGILYLLYIIFVYFGLSGYGIYQLFKNYKRSSGEKQAQIRFLIAGSVVGFGAGAANFPLWYNIPIIPYTTPLVALYIVIFGYAMFKHHLMDVRVILTEFLVALIGLILLIQATLAKTLWDVFLRVGILVLFSFFGWQLIRSILLEIKRRKEIEALNIKLTRSLKEIKAKDKKLRELYKVRKEFLDIASHQLRTPVSVIIGNLDMMREGTVFTLPKEKQKMFIEGLYQKGKKLSSIIDDILTASEMEEGKLRLTLNPVQIEEVIEKIIKDLEIEAKERNLKFEFRKPKKLLPKIISDEMYLREAISNLVDNAIKYTKKGEVIVSAYSQNGYVICEVKDTGIGIPKEEQPKIFDQFSRASNAKEMYTDGTGLGTWIAKIIVESHPEGKIWFESEEGKGTTFYIKLPIIKK